MPSLWMRPSACLRLEALEDRTLLSWGTIPPAVVRVSSPTTIILNNQHVRAGSAEITHNEIDYYQFQAPVSGTYRIQTTTPNSQLDTVLGLFNQSGQRIAFNNDISPALRNSRVTVNLIAGRVYVFGITNLIHTPGRRYNWSVQRLNLSSSTPIDDAYEDNDTLATAHDLGSLTQRRTISNLILADSADWFRFTTTGLGRENDYVALLFRHAQGDLDLRLTDARGNVVRSSTSGNDNERISLNGLSAGTYYLQIYGYQGAKNPNYTLEILPPSQPSRLPESNVLYLNFDGANISHADLVRWAGSDWPHMLNTFDAEGDGVVVEPFLASRGDRDEIIAKMIELLKEDLTPFGIEVRRTTGLAVEGVGATTVFLGKSTLSNGTHLASMVDIGNTNVTDIAFVGNESWGTVEQAALALADVTLHEAGHTWGLWHVDSGNDLETMGYRYSAAPHLSRAVNTAFLDRTYAAFVDSKGTVHGPGPLNTYQTMLGNFVPSSQRRLPTAAPVIVDMSRPAAFLITTSSPAIDRVWIRCLPSGRIEVTINGRKYELARGYRAIIVNTSGDRRDQVRVLNQLGDVRVGINRQLGAEVQILTKTPLQWAYFWATGQLSVNTRQLSCGCPSCLATVTAKDEVWSLMASEA